MLTSKSFNRYSPHEKQDMKSEALYRLMRALSRADLSQGPKKVWSYMTRTVFCSYLGILSRKYRDVERSFKLAHDALAAQGCSEAKIEQLLGRKAGEKLSFGIARSRWYVYGYKTEAQRKAEAEAAA